MLLSSKQAMNMADLLTTHLNGVIAHGQRTFRGFLDIGQYPHDANLSINTLLRVLNELAVSMVRARFLYKECLMHPS